MKSKILMIMVVSILMLPLTLHANSAKENMATHQTFPDFLNEDTNFGKRIDKKEISAIFYYEGKVYYLYEKEKNMLVDTFERENNSQKMFFLKIMINKQ